MTGHEVARDRLRWMRDALDAEISVLATLEDGALFVLVRHLDIETAERCPIDLFVIKASPP